MCHRFTFYHVHLSSIKIENPSRASAISQEKTTSLPCNCLSLSLSLSLWSLVVGHRFPTIESATYLKSNRLRTSEKLIATRVLDDVNYPLDDTRRSIDVETNSPKRPTHPLRYSYNFPCVLSAYGESKNYRLVLFEEKSKRICIYTLLYLLKLFVYLIVWYIWKIFTLYVYRSDI